MNPDHVPVHVANTDELAAAVVGAAAAATPKPASPHRPELVAIASTIVITADDPAPELLPQDKKRAFALIQAIDDDTVLLTNKAQRNAAANQISGMPNPAGGLIPKANTAPWPVHGTNQMWVTNQGQAGRVTVVAFVRTE